MVPCTISGLVGIRYVFERKSTRIESARALERAANSVTMTDWDRISQQLGL